MEKRIRDSIIAKVEAIPDAYTDFVNFVLRACENDKVVCEKVIEFLENTSDLSTDAVSEYIYDIDDRFPKRINTAQKAE